MARPRRVYQIAEQIRMVVASELHHVADPRLQLVTISSVMVSPDLRHAKVYWVISGDEQRKQEVATAFKISAGYFRKAVASELGIKFVPELRFYYDDTLDTTDEVNRLLAKIR